MVLKQLAYLIALAREQHFGRAAAASNISQPTLSAAIRSLEDELGLPVVERGHRFNGFTPQGQIVLDHAKRIMAECSAMRQSLDELTAGLSGRLRLGAVPTALPVISHLTAPFYARYPKVAVTVLSLTSDQITRGIDNFDLDAGITYLDNEALPSVRSKPIYAEEYVFLTHTGDVFAGRETLTWAEAADAPLCLLTPDMQNRRIIDGIFRSVGKSPVPAMETNSIFNLCSHAASGHWSSIVPRPLLRFFGLPKNTVAVPLVEPDTHRSMGLIISDREPSSPLAKALFVSVEAIEIENVLAPPRDFLETVQ
jgi:DNA-binding transcriptional LysR family regulator